MFQISKEQEEHALELHKKSIVVDFHCDAVGATLPYPRLAFGGIRSFDGGVKRTLAERSTEGHVDIPRLLEGGVDCQVFSHWVEPIYNPIAPWRMLQVMGYSLPEIEKNSDKLEIVTKAGVDGGFSGKEESSANAEIAGVYSRYVVEFKYKRNESTKS